MEGTGEHQERYPCNFCDKVFFSYQALGGHQNSHREEREIAVRRLRDAHLSLPNARSHTPNITMQAAARTQSNMLLPTGHTHAPNNENISMPHHANYYFRRPYVPTRSIPRDSHFHPYARQNHFYQNINPYNGFRCPTTNPFRPTYGYPMYRLPSAYQQVETYLGPRTYDFFAAEEHRMATANNRVNIHSSNSSNGGVGNITENSIAASSNAIQNHVRENVTNNITCDKNGVSDGPDLTLRL